MIKKTAEELLYKRGKGSLVLKKRLTALYYILPLLPLVAYFLLYIYKNNEIKSLTRNIDELEKQKKVQIDKYRFLVAEYDKISSSQEVKDYAEMVLKMEPVSKEMRSFTVLDRNLVFAPTDYDDMPNLFENKLNLAINQKESKSDEEKSNSLTE